MSSNGVRESAAVVRLLHHGPAGIAVSLEPQRTLQPEPGAQDFFLGAGARQYPAGTAACRSGVKGLTGAGRRNKAKNGIERRNKIAGKYDEALQNTSLIRPFRDESIYHAFHLYVIQTNHRKALYDFLRKNKIFTQVHYIPVHLQPYYKNKGWKRGDFPMVEDYYAKCLSLPMYPTLSEQEQDYVIEKIKQFLDEK